MPRIHRTSHLVLLALYDCSFAARYKTVANITQYPPQISLMDQGMPILALPDTPDQHSHGVHINTQLPAEWASMSLQVPSYGASRASPVPITRRSSNRHHPYLAPAPTYRGRLSRSLSSELSQPAPPYPAPIPISQSMSHIEQHPTYLSVPAYNYPATPATPPTPTIIITPSTPRRVRIPQSFAPGRSRRHPAYTVRFKVDGAAGFRVGDALADQSFAVDNPDDVVLETCVDRKGHLQVDVSPRLSFTHYTVLTIFDRSFPPCPARGRASSSAAPISTCNGRSR